MSKTQAVLITLAMTLSALSLAANATAPSAVAPGRYCWLSAVLSWIVSPQVGEVTNATSRRRPYPGHQRATSYQLRRVRLVHRVSET
jgi:hypothetical protein